MSVPKGNFGAVTVTTQGQNSRNTLAVLSIYSHFGMSVIPLAPNSKQPALSSWAEFQRRRPNEAEMRTWWGNGHQNGIAIVCGKVSNLVVLDIDDPDKFGVALNAIGETLPDTPIVRTRKGWHVYFKYPQNRIVRRHVRLSDWGAELRGDGCYVVAPPTEIDGHRYHWAKRNGKLLALGQVPLADCPEWLLDAFGVPLTDQPERHELKTEKSPQPSQQTLTPEQRNAIKAVLLPHWHEGVRHELALGLAGLLAKSGITQDEALELLREIAAEAQDNEWRDRERALKDSFDRLWRGEQVIGFKRLEDILGEQTAKVIASIVSPRKGTNGKANATVELLTLSEWNGRLAHITQGQWLVDGLLRPSWLFILNARPKVGKSIVAVNLATALANGTPFLNQQTNPCAVVYIDLERPIETLNRFKVLGALDNPNIFVPAERVGADLLDALRDLIRQAKDRTNRPVVVFVDTLGDFIKPALRQRKASINDYDAIAEILQELRDLALELGCAFVFVHHTRKSQSDEPSEVDVLGSTAIAGKFDVIAHLHPDRTDASVLSLVAEGNAIAKTTLHFAIEDAFKLTPCEPPAKTKEEQAAREIKRLLERHPEGKLFGELVDYLFEIGLTTSRDAAKRLTIRALDLIPNLTRSAEGRNVRYRLPDQPPLVPTTIGDKGIGDNEVKGNSLSPMSPVQRNGSKCGQNRENFGDKGFVTNCHQLSPISPSIGDTGDKGDNIGLSPMSPMSPIRVTTGDNSPVTLVTNENPNEIRQNSQLVTQVTNSYTLSPLSPVTPPVPNLPQSPEPEAASLREDELIDVETLLSELDSQPIDLEAFVSESLAETDDDGFIDTEELLASLEPEPPPTTRPDNLACLCGGRLRAVGRTYRCSKCNNPLPVVCRNCGKVLQVTDVGLAKCLGCGLDYTFDASRQRWLSDLDLL